MHFFKIDPFLKVFWAVIACGILLTIFEITLQRISSNLKGKRHNPQKKNNNAIKGNLFELYIGELLKKDGWTIDYHGMRMKKKDQGVDLIAKKTNITALIQCKYKSPTSWTLGDETINTIFGSVNSYKLEHPEENNIHLAVVTTGKFYPDTKRKAENNGIELVDRFTLPELTQFKP
ncbi:MAG: restriction endonuclease [Nitrospinae bacterium]|nr:restriction endonuclease [Nitrospinota bacterium]